MSSASIRLSMRAWWDYWRSRSLAILEVMASSTLAPGVEDILLRRRFYTMKPSRRLTSLFLHCSSLSSRLCLSPYSSYFFFWASNAPSISFSLLFSFFSPSLEVGFVGESFTEIDSMGMVDSLMVIGSCGLDVECYGLGDLVTAVVLMRVFTSWAALAKRRVARFCLIVSESLGGQSRMQQTKTVRLVYPRL